MSASTGKGKTRVRTLTHWGAYEVDVAGDEIVALHPFGGYSHSVNSYSTAAAEVIVPRVLGARFREVLDTMAQ